MSVFNTSQFNAKLNAYKVKKNLVARMAMDYETDKLTETMRDKAPWTDRTGMARSSIHKENHFDGDEISVSMGIGVDYGKYLEVYHEKRFATIMPTLLKNRGLILKDMIKVLDISGRI